jgi:hypothetical protein
MSILEYYTLNDCCTGEPVVINNFEPQFNGQILYLTYDGDCVPGFCPVDLENLIITNITNEAELNFEGCFVLTQINELPEDVLELEYENVIFGVQTVPLCEDCQECPQQCYSNCYVAVLVNTTSTEDSFSFVDCSGFTQTITLLSGDTAIINLDVTVPTSGNTKVEYINEAETMYYFGSCCEDNQVFSILANSVTIPNQVSLYGENFILSETSQDIKYNCMGLINEASIDVCPPVSGNLVSAIINQVIVGKSDCFDCTSRFPCSQKCYGLLACNGIYDLITSTDPGLSDYVDTFVNIDIISPVPESPQTLFLVKNLGEIDCPQEYTFTYSASTGTCDCQCYIFKTPSEAFITSFVDCNDNLLQVFLPTGKTTSICSLVRPIFDTQTNIPIKLGGPCINGECPDQPAVTITPRNECDVLTIFPMGATCVVTHPTSIKAFNGQAQLIVTGGTPPYTISWDIGSVTPIINNLNVGNYNATITDFYNDFTINTTCVLTAQTPTTTTTTTTPPLPTFDDLCVRILTTIKGDRLSSSTIENIPMSFNGYLNEKPTWISDNNDYLIYWNTGSTPNYWEVSGSPTSLISYTTQVPPLVGWAAYGAPNVKNVTVISGECTNTIPLNFTATPTPTICDNNGTITILATGGDGIYQYSINNGNTFGTINIFQNLAPGTYIVHVKDGLGQTTIQSVVVGQTPAPTINLSLQVSSSNINGNTFTITSNIPPGYTVSFDINNTSNFSYYQSPLPPPGTLPTYNNVVTLTNPALGSLPLVGTSNSSNPVTDVPRCGEEIPTLTQFNETKQYSTNLTMTNGQTITGTFTNSIIETSVDTKCKFTDGTFTITITNPIVINCECCPVTVTSTILNDVIGGGGINLVPLG